MEENTKNDGKLRTPADLFGAVRPEARYTPPTEKEKEKPAEEKPATTVH